MGKGNSQGNQNNITQAEQGLLSQAQSQSNQLFQTSFPGFGTAEKYYQSLASGNPQQISSAIAPAVGQINTATQGASQNIALNTPRGGVEQMAQANLQSQRAGQIGNLATQAYTGSFPALASLSQGGLGLAGGATGNAISAGSAASSSNQALMQAQQEGKGSALGFAGSLAGVGGELGSTAMMMK